MLNLAIREEIQEIIKAIYEKGARLPNVNYLLKEKDGFYVLTFPLEMTSYREVKPIVKTVMKEFSWKYVSAAKTDHPFLFRMSVTYKKEIPPCQE